MANLHGTKNKFVSVREEEGDVLSYIIINFLVRFKVETVESYQLTPVASTMDSGMEVRKWIVSLVVSLVNKVINNESVLEDKSWNPLPIAVLGVIFYEVLEEEGNMNNKLIGNGVVIEG